MTVRALPLLRAVIFAALFVAILAVVAAAEPRQVQDASGRTVAIDDTSRVAAVGGSITEVLYALGLEEHIVAVDTTSLYPPQAMAEKPNVGYLRALSAEGVLSVAPSLILAEADAGPPEAISILEKASIPFVRVPDEQTAEGVVAKVRFIGEVMGVAERSERLAADMALDFAALRQELRAVETPSRAIFILSLSEGRIMAAGEGTSADAMLRLAGAENALSGFSGYKLTSPEAVLAAEPDAIVMMERHGNGPGPGAAVADVLAHPTLAETPAARNRRIVPMDGLYLLGFGPRTAHAAHDLAAALYPERDLPPLAARAWTESPAAAQ